MQPLVDVDWLRAHLDEVILLDASVTRIDRGTGVTEFAPGPEGFAKAHIPTARFADLMGDFSAKGARFGFSAPTQDELRRAAQSLGINQDSKLVIYDSLGGAYAARLRYMLRGAGLAQVALLDGGLAAWIGAGHAVETGMAEAADADLAAGNFTPAPIEDLFIGQAEVEALSLAPLADVPLICALREVQYAAGHIPNSLNIPYPALLDAQGLFDPQRLRKALDELGLGADISPVLYCGGGINAAGLALGFELLGIEDVAIYDDSMAGWRAASLPIETGMRDA